jgi:hypothetical protein
MAEEKRPHIISATEVANYVVCPEAWRLKLHERKVFVKSTEGEKIRHDWVAQQDTGYQLKKYAKIAYALLVLLVIVVFLLDRQRTEKKRRLLEQQQAISASGAQP